MRRFAGTPSQAVRAGVCPMCLGRGEVNVLVPPPEHEITCPTCHGTGAWPPPDLRLIALEAMQAGVCPSCYGGLRDDRSSCSSCRGSGMWPPTEIVTAHPVAVGRQWTYTCSGCDTADPPRFPSEEQALRAGQAHLPRHHEEALARLARMVARQEELADPMRFDRLHDRHGLEGM